MYLGVGKGNPLQYSWRIPWTEEPGGLRSIGTQRVGHNWSNLAQDDVSISIYLLSIYIFIFKVDFLGFPGGSVVVEGSPPPSAGDEGFVPSLGGFCVPQSSWACAPQLLSQWFRAPEPQLLSPQLLKPAHSGASSPQWDRPPQWETCTRQL